MNSDSDSEFINLSSDCESIILIDEKEVLEERLKKSIMKLFKIYTLEKAMEKINAIVSEVREKLLLASRNKTVESVALLSDYASCNSVPVNTASIEFEERPEREKRTYSKNHRLANMSRQKEIKKRKEKEKRVSKDKVSDSSKEADACVPPCKAPNQRQIRTSAGANSLKIEEYKRLRGVGKILARNGALEEALNIYELAKEKFTTYTSQRRIEKLKSFLSGIKVRTPHHRKMLRKRNTEAELPNRFNRFSDSVSVSVAFSGDVELGPNISDENQDSVENKKSSGSVEQSASQGSLPHDSELPGQSNILHRKGLKNRTHSSCRWSKENHPSSRSNRSSANSRARKRKKKPQSSSIAKPVDTVPRNKKTKRARVKKEKANSSKNPELCKCPFNCSANISRLTEIEKHLNKLTERKKTLKEKKKKKKSSKKEKERRVKRQTSISRQI